jgi:hypothetical protein
MTDPHAVSDPCYSVHRTLRELSDSMWLHYAHDLVDRACAGHTYRMLQAHPLYLLTAAEFAAGMLTGQPNPDRFFLPALHEELDRAGVPPSAVHQSLGYALPLRGAQPSKG